MKLSPVSTYLDTAVKRWTAIVVMVSGTVASTVAGGEWLATKVDGYNDARYVNEEDAVVSENRIVDSVQQVLLSEKLEQVEDNIDYRSAVIEIKRAKGLDISIDQLDLEKDIRTQKRLMQEVND